MCCGDCTNAVMTMADEIIDSVIDFAEQDEVDPIEYLKTLMERIANRIEELENDSDDDTDDEETDTEITSS